MTQKAVAPSALRKVKEHQPSIDHMPQTAAQVIAFAHFAVTLYPDFSLPTLLVGRSAFGVVLVCVEVFVAFSFISGLLTRVGALILIAVFLCTLFFYPVWGGWM